MGFASFGDRFRSIWVKEDSYFIRILILLVVATRLLSVANLKYLTGEKTAWRKNFMDVYVVLWFLLLSAILGCSRSHEWHGWVAAYYVGELVHYRIYFLFVKGWEEPWLLSKLRRSLALALITTVQLILAYATIFRALGRIGTAGTKPVEATILAPIQALYFSTITFTTVGYGDLVPLDYTSQILVMTEVASALLTLALIVPLVLTGFAVGLHRLEAGHTD